MIDGWSHLKNCNLGYIIDELGKKFKIGHHKKRFSFFKILFSQKVSEENFLKKSAPPYVHRGEGNDFSIKYIPPIQRKSYR